MYELLSIDELVDGRHPNERGHQKICDVILNKIEDVIDTMK